MKRFLWMASTAFMLLFVGCGGGDEAKELLDRLLRVVGIPYEIVVNICQDENDNGICESFELQTKITIAQGESVEDIWRKIILDENGTYLLHNYDPTKKILMEIEDNEYLNNTGQRVTLSFQPKDVEEVPVQELSILQSLIDNGLMSEEELSDLRDSTVRVYIDRILLENVFYNQNILEEHNLPAPDATIKNLEYIAEGLRDINVSGDFVEEFESCEDNASCQTLLIEDAKEQTVITKEEAEIIAETNSTEGTGDRNTILTVEEGNATTVNEEDDNTTSSTNDSTSESDEESSEDDNGSTEDDNSTSTTEEEETVVYVPPATETETESSEKNAADGYIIKLATPATATCYNSDFSAVIGNYTSDMTVGEKGKLTFNGVTLDDHCSITIPSGATIDSNNNGVLDSTDKVINFEMKTIGDTTLVSPLTTLMYLKHEKGEDTTLFKNMVASFDPVTATTEIESRSGSEKISMQKLMALMEVLKTMLSDGDVDLLPDIDLSTVIETNSSESFADFDVSKLLINIPSDKQPKLQAKAKNLQDIFQLTEVIDPDIIDLDTFIINISDGEMDLLSAFQHAVRDSAPQATKDAIAGATDINSTIPNVVKSTYSSDAIETIIGYFSIISENLNSIYGGNFGLRLFDINTTLLLGSRTFYFTNEYELDRVIELYSLDDLMRDDYYNYLDTYNYDIYYQKNYGDDTSSDFKIKTNHIARFEIVEGLDSDLFEISEGNRFVAYLDLKEGLDSPTADNPQDANGDGIYEIDVKATDVQMLTTKTVRLYFKILNTTVTESNTTDTVTYIPFSVEHGYIHQDAKVGGLVLDRTNYYDLWTDITSLIHLNDGFVPESLELAGEGAEDFEIVDNSEIQVVNALDYNATPQYNLTVVATDSNGNEFNQSLTIDVITESRVLDFSQRNTLELLATRSLLNENAYSSNGVDYLDLNGSNIPARITVQPMLDAKYFQTYADRYADRDYSMIEDYTWLEINSSLNPTYATKEDANGDGIYEVNVTATDVQTLEQTTILLRYKLVSSTLRFDRYNGDRNDRNEFYVEDTTVVGGEVPYSLFRVDTAPDVNITDFSLDGNGSEDFNITNHAIVVVNTLDLARQSEYNLTLTMTDTTGFSTQKALFIRVQSGTPNENLAITNPEDLHIDWYGLYWGDVYSFSIDYGGIDLNNLARIRFVGEDATRLYGDYTLDEENEHSRYFYLSRRWEDAYPTYLNPQDANKDNIYEGRVEFTDIETLQTITQDIRYHILSHQVRPYITGYYYTPLYEYNNNSEINLSIPAEAPIGGELLALDGAKGFYTRVGSEIELGEVTLEGDGAEKFQIVGNTITLKESVSSGEEYNLTLVVTDSEAQESRNPLYIVVDSIFDPENLLHGIVPEVMAKEQRPVMNKMTFPQSIDYSKMPKGYYPPLPCPEEEPAVK